MTDRIHSLTVVLEDAVREEGADALAAAIRMMRGVIEVAPNVANVDFYVARSQAAQRLRASVYEALTPQRSASDAA